MDYLDENADHISINEDGEYERDNLSFSENNI